MKKFFLVTVVAVLAVFACQKQESISEQRNQQVVQTRSLVTPENLAQNESFKNLSNIYLGTLNHIRPQFYMASNEEQNNLSNLLNSSTEIQEDEAAQVLDFLGYSEEEMFSLVNESKIAYNFVKLDFPSLENLTKEEHSTLFKEAFSVYISDIGGTGGILADDEFEFQGDTITRKFGCIIPSGIKSNPIAGEESCKDIVKCRREFDNSAEAAAAQYTLDAVACAESGFSVFEGLLGAGVSVGAGITLATSGTGAGTIITGGAIGGVIGFFGGTITGLLCLNAAHTKWETACTAAHIQFDKCCFE